MQNFCEECGNQLTPGDQFCDQCGTKLPQTAETTDNTENTRQEPDITFSFFKEKRIQAKPKHDTHYGILLINSQKLNNKFGQQAAGQIINNLGAYTDYYKNFGVQYLVLDTAANHMKKVAGKNWKHHVNILRLGIRKMHDVLRVKCHFIMLLGGDDFIPMPVFPNPNDGISDKDVDSDLPYSTLSVENPMKDSDARNPKICVGRIPTGTDTTADDIINLLRNTQKAITNFSTRKTFGLSANVWQEVSNLINSRVGRENLYISPGLTIDNLMQYYTHGTHIHYFNLHGSDRSPYWVGQKGSSYPVAFTPAAIQQCEEHNVVGVEACYGARFIGLPKEESILLTALSTHTVSFVGSSRIAFGPAAPPMGLADVVIHDFLLLLQQGVTAGEAFLKARSNAFNKSVERSPANSLLTLMEFNLFGDPVFFIANAKKELSKSAEPDREKAGLENPGSSDDNLDEINDSSLEKEIKPDDEDSIYSRVTRAVDETQRKITALINKKVWDKYPEFKNIEPAFRKYDFQGKNFNSLVYGKSLELFDQYLSVTTDEQGEILDEAGSK